MLLSILFLYFIQNELQFHDFNKALRCSDQKFIQNPKHVSTSLGSIRQRLYLRESKKIPDSRIFDTKYDKLVVGYDCDQSEYVFGHILNISLFGYTEDDKNRRKYLETTMIKTSERIPCSVGQIHQTRTDHIHFNPKRKYCSVVAYMHEDFIKRFRDMNHAKMSILKSIHEGNNLLENIEIYGVKGTIKLFVERFETVRDTDIGVDDFKKDEDNVLNQFVGYLKKQKKSCLNVLFTHYYWEGVLGVAEVGSDAYSGTCGINNGFVVTSDETGISSQVIENAIFIHELLHILGSLHDPDKRCRYKTVHCPRGPIDNECIGDFIDGSYIMHPTVQHLGGKNSYNMSSCTKFYIQRVMSYPRRRVCFKEHITYCGNGIIDPGEMCDVGPDGDDCCSSTCVLKENSQCSPLSGNCCSSDCRIKKATDLCSDKTDCADESYCDGVTIDCPNPQPINEDIGCNSLKGVCKDGLCSNAVCESKNMVTCMNRDPRFLCIIACINSEGECVPIKIRNFYRNKLKNSPCNDGHGYCSEDGKCIMTVPDTEISIFVENILNDSIFLKIRQYYRERTYIFMFIISVIVIIILSLTSCNKSNKIREAHEIELQNILAKSS